MTIRVPAECALKRADMIGALISMSADAGVTPTDVARQGPQTKGNPDEAGQEECSLRIHATSLNFLFNSRQLDAFFDRS